MTLPKQKKDESDADYAIRLEKAREAIRESDRKSNRKYREANREAVLERKRKYREANREAIRERFRKYREAKVLASAYGKPLKSNFSRAQRPKILQVEIVAEAKRLCREYGFPQEAYVDKDWLTAAARSIRDNPVYPNVLPLEQVTEITNPWYNSDYLHESALLHGSRGLSARLKRNPDYYNGGAI